LFLVVRFREATTRPGTAGWGACGRHQRYLDHWRRLRPTSL